jgi:AraC-like DNA-binding protein
VGVVLALHPGQTVVVRSVGGAHAAALVAGDPHVGRALTLLHGQVARDWTLPKLGREVGLSRSTLAERFNTLVGQPPMQYLTQWRMQVAAGMLANGGSKVAVVAQQVGYDSEAAFSRAFKKATGVPPASWRRTGSVG